MSQPDVYREAGGAGGGSVRVMKLRYAGKCRCGEQLTAGSRAGWNAATRTVICETCLPPATPFQPEQLASEHPPSGEVDIGRAGASLARQYERRAAQREARVRRQHPRIGGLILALSDEPQSTRAFASGAVGEQKAARRIVEASPDALFLLNRRLSRGSRSGDVDMIAITSRGIHVIDVKRYVDQSVEVRRSGGFFGPVSEQLVIGGRDKTKLLESLDRQVEAVSVALSDCATAVPPIAPSLCFVDTDLPLLRNRNLQIRGVLVLGLRGTTKLLARSSGSLTVDQRELIHAHLADRMPAA